MTLFIIIIVAAVILGVLMGIGKANAIAAAQKAYQASLRDLSADPTNTRKRQDTLALGRNYSNLTRDKKGVTIFDEVALMNDINAACGSGAQRPATAPAGQPSSADTGVSARLAKLQALKDQNLIRDDEYQAKRQQIIDEI